MRRAIRVGQTAPDCLLTLLDGQGVSLSAYWGKGKAVLIVFLRHLA